MRLVFYGFILFSAVLVGFIPHFPAGWSNNPLYSMLYTNSFSSRIIPVYAEWNSELCFGLKYNVSCFLTLQKVFIVKLSFFSKFLNSAACTARLNIIVTITINALRKMP